MKRALSDPRLARVLPEVGAARAVAQPARTRGEWG